MKGVDELYVIVLMPPGVTAPNIHGFLGYRKDGARFAPVQKHTNGYQHASTALPTRFQRSEGERGLSVELAETTTPCDAIKDYNVKDVTLRCVTTEGSRAADEHTGTASIASKAASTHCLGSAE